MRNLLIFVLVLALGVAPGAVSSAPAAQIVDRIVAVVNGEIITLFELNQKLAPHLRALRGKPVTEEDAERVRVLRKNLLTKMVDELLLLDEAKRLGLQVADTEVENHIRQLKRRNNLTEDDLQRQLRLEKMTRQEYEQYIRDDMRRFQLLSAMVTRKVLVSDDEVVEYYDQNKGKYQQEREARLGLILLPQGQNPDELVERIRSGELTFAEAAKQFSQGPGSQEGGDLGWIKWAEIAEDWKASLDGVDQGGLGKPFQLGGRPAILSIHPGVESRRRQISGRRPRRNPGSSAQAEV